MIAFIIISFSLAFTEKNMVVATTKKISIASKENDKWSYFKNLRDNLTKSKSNNAEAIVYKNGFLVATEEFSKEKSCQEMEFSINSRFINTGHQGSFLKDARNLLKLFCK